tara:strand:- start:3008 stop:3976 length:969 start_codon:yes stop_codon:yes gene_type:complete
VSHDGSSLPTIVVTGVGAVIGQGILESLRAIDEPVRILGVDRNPKSVGRELCDEFRVKPSGSEDKAEYLDFWLELARESDLVLPGIEQDVFFLDNHRDELASSKLGLNTPSLINLARDKWEQVKVADQWAIPTLVDADWEECVRKLGGPPLLLKPRRGSGSRGIVKLEKKEDWVLHSDGFNLIQRIVGRDTNEYTVGLFGLGRGRLMPPIVFRRELSEEGHTRFAEVVNDAEIVAAVSELGERLQPIGPTNFQFRKGDGKTWLLEINPRFSSSTIMRTRFGYNEAAMALEHYLRSCEPPSPVIRFGRAQRLGINRVQMEFDN